MVRAVRSPSLRASERQSHSARATGGEGGDREAGLYSSESIRLASQSDMSCLREFIYTMAERRIVT